MWKEICISNLIGLACRGKEISHFCFVLLCIRGQIPEVQAPQGAYIWRGDLTEVFLCYDFGGLIFAILRYLYRYGHFLSLAASSSLFEEFMSALTSFPDTRHIFDVIARYEKVRAVKLMT